MAFGTFKASTLENKEGGPNLIEGIPKAWVNFDSNAATLSVQDSFNVTSMTDNAVGDYTVTFNNDFTGTNYCAGGLSGGQIATDVQRCMAIQGTTAGGPSNKLAGECDVNGFDSANGSLIDNAENNALFIGDLA